MTVVLRVVAWGGGGGYFVLFFLFILTCESLENTAFIIACFMFSGMLHGVQV